MLQINDKTMLSSLLIN